MTRIKTCSTLSLTKRLAREERKVNKELGYESSIIPEYDECERYTTRLNLTRILETDEDNLY